MQHALVTQSRLADLLAVSERTLERWRVEGIGPAYVKAGRRVLYRMEDVENWLSNSRRRSTSEAPEAANA
jgi:predicted site-specific integrase-resolvase